MIHVQPITYSCDSGIEREWAKLALGMVCEMGDPGADSMAALILPWAN